MTVAAVSLLAQLAVRGCLQRQHRSFGSQVLCLKSLTTPYIVHYIVTTLFCSAVRMSSGKYYTLYGVLKVSHDVSRKVVRNRWSIASNISHHALRCGQTHGGFNSHFLLP